MSADGRGKDGATKPAWATTEPLPNPVAAARGEAPSPDSSGSLDASGLPKKIAEVKRSAEVESILEALSYPRPHVKVDRPETDSDLAAAHHVGPRPVPAAVPTSTLEPPLMLSQSLVEAIRAPATPAPPVVTKPRVDHGATVLVARKKNKRLLYALGPCALLTVLLVWGLTRSTEHTTASPIRPTPSAAPAPVVASAPIASSPVESPGAPAAPASAPAPTIASAPLPERRPAVAASPAPRPARTPAPHAAPKASATASPAPRDTSSLRTDFEVQN
jgi:hypothetical protein